MNTSQNSRAPYAERLLPTPQGTGELQNMSSIPPGSPGPAPVRHCRSSFSSSKGQKLDAWGGQNFTPILAALEVEILHLTVV